MKLPKYVRLKPNRSVFYYQRRVPPAVRHAPPFNAMPELYEVSLGTSDANELLRILANKNEWFEACVTAVMAGATAPEEPTKRQQLEAQLRPMNSTWAAYHGLQRYKYLVDSTLLRRRAAIRGAEGAAQQLEDWDDNELATVGSRIDQLDAEEWDVTRREALDIFVEEGRIKRPVRESWRDHFKKHPIEETPEFKLLCEQLGRGELEAANHINAMRPGSLERYEITTPSLRTAPRALDERNEHDIRVVVKKVVAAAADKGDAWRERLQRATNIWVEMALPTDMRDVKRSHVVDFVEKLRKCPANLKQRLPGLSVSEAILANETKKLPTLSANSIKDAYLAPLKSIFAYAENRELIAKNPVSKVPVSGAKKVGRGTHFEAHELNTLFSLPLFAGCANSEEVLAPGSVMLNDHWFWAPLLALFTGARTGEIAQLKVDEVIVTGTVPHLLIQSDEGRRVKTSAARRSVPIHEALLKIGFAEYVERQRKRGSERLFPEWENPGGKGYSEAASQRHFKRTVLPKVSKRTSPNPTFHSFRHTMKNAMVASGLSPQLQNAILGHEQSGMDPSYLTSVTIETRGRAMAKVQFEGLQIEHLFGTRR